MASGKNDTYNSSCLYDSDEMSFSDSNGTLSIKIVVGKIQESVEC